MGKRDELREATRSFQAALKNSGDKGPFEGNGWTEKKKWLEEANRTSPKKVSPARAKAIIQKARSLAKHGPWSDQLAGAMTQGEHRFINDYWESLPGNTSYVNAIESIASGKADKAASVESPQELQAELQSILAYVEGPDRPSREVLGSKLRGLAGRVAAKSTKPVRVKIEGWGGERKIPKKELQAFAKALKSAPELKGSGLGFAVLMAGGPHVQINPKYLDKLEKVVKSQGRRMGPPKVGGGINEIEENF